MLRDYRIEYFLVTVPDVRPGLDPSPFESNDPACLEYDLPLGAKILRVDLLGYSLALSALCPLRDDDDVNIGQTVRRRFIVASSAHELSLPETYRFLGTCGQGCLQRFIFEYVL